ncbi:hypothetical protein [Conexibacter woesei]|uniref:hypothetical protein n=1 Tax=Conexibacter woesei TaxID=191495 RepID=UPI0004275EEB|nr:hypothetical protein [Conexibacter woesei]
MRFTSNTTGKSYNCTSSQLRATLISATGQAPLLVSSNVAWTFPASGSCTVTGGLSVNIGCTTSENWVVLGITVSGITAGQAGLDCTVSLSASPTCRVRIAGSVPMQFDNLGTVTVPNTGQSLAATGSTCTTLPNDTSVTVSTPAGPSIIYAVSPLFTLSVS